MILQILNEIAATSKTTEKLAILKRNQDNELLKEVFRLAYNLRISYYIKKVPNAKLVRGVCTLSDALDFLENCLAKRVLTGNAAIEKLSETLGLLNVYEREVLRRVIMRDLECGASGTSACKIWGDDLIPSQPCMKASAYTEKTIAKIVYPAIAQLKADGTRCMIVKQDGVVTAWSRNGKEFIGIEPVLKAVRDFPHDDFVLDGELVYKTNLGKCPTEVKPVDNFCATKLDTSGSLSWMFGEDEREAEPELSKAKQFKEENVADRSTGNGIVGKAIKGTLSPEEAENIVFQCWDSLTTDDYWQGKADVPYTKRMEGAIEIINRIDDIHLEWIETHEVNSLEEAKEVYRMYVDLELEGIILKNKSGIWEDKRSKDQVKFKEVIDFDAEIIGYYPHRKDPTKLGGFTLRSKCGRIQNNIGSGLKDGKASLKMSDRDPLDRTLLMTVAEAMIGCVLECECNGTVINKNAKPGDAPYSLFLPVIKKIRTDKDAQDANTMLEVFGK